MPDGSSSAAPVTRPGPSKRSTMPRDALRTGRVVSAMKSDNRGECENRSDLDQIAFRGKVPVARACGNARLEKACFKAASFDADEGAPDRGEARASQHIVRIVAEDAAIPAHVGAE